MAQEPVSKDPQAISAIAVNLNRQYVFAPLLALLSSVAPAVEVLLLPGPRKDRSKLRSVHPKTPAHRGAAVILSYSLDGRLPLLDQAF